MESSRVTAPRRKQKQTDAELKRAAYLFDPGGIRDAEAPPEDSARLFWMFLSLIRKRELDYATYYREFRRSSKTFGRDITKLRAIGAKYQFTVTRARNGRAVLANLSDIADPRNKAGAVAADTLRAVAEALGELVANDVLGYVDASAAGRDPFLRIATPQLVSQSKVAAIFGHLRQASHRRSRVRFRYPVREANTARPRTEERTVEPHLVTYYDGRYYLVAYDRRPRTDGWRQFALDRIEGDITPAGTFEPRVVPRHYRGEDAVGLFKTGPRHEVEIAICPTIAQSVLGRLWQHQQKVQSAAGRWPTIIFEVFDLGEAVRWALGFGGSAIVVAPPAAVSLAYETATRMMEAHTVGAVARVAADPSTG